MIKLKHNGQIYKFLDKYREHNVTTQFCPMARQLIYKRILLVIAVVFLPFFAVGIILTPLHWFYAFWGMPFAYDDSVIGIFVKMSMLVEGLIVGIVIWIFADMACRKLF